MRLAMILGATAALATAAGAASAQRAGASRYDRADAPYRHGSRAASLHETPSVTRPIDRDPSRDESIPPSAATGYDDGYGYAGGTYAPVYPAEPAAPVRHLLPAQSVRLAADGAIVATTSVGAERDTTYYDRSAARRAARSSQQTAPTRRNR